MSLFPESPGRGPSTARRSGPRLERWFAAIPPGLEPVLARELSGLAELDGVELEVQPGGVGFSAPLAVGAGVTARVRSASSVRVEVAQGPAKRLSDLGALARSVDWTRFGLTSTHPEHLQLHGSLKGSRLQRRDAAEDKVRQAIGVTVRGRAPGGPGPVTHVSIRVSGPRAAISVFAGRGMHIRGWRRSNVAAPIRENLAAALLIAGGWEPGEPLLDPFCGSGTLPIEAAVFAAGRLPGPTERLSCSTWPDVVLPALQGPQATASHIVGSDHHGASLDACRANAAAAGVSVQWLLQDVADAAPTGDPGLVVANPPYGRRLGRDVKGVYQAFGQTLRRRFDGWRALFLAPDPRLADAVHRSAAPLTTFSNGGTRIGLYALDLTGS